MFRLRNSKRCARNWFDRKKKAQFSAIDWDFALRLIGRLACVVRRMRKVSKSAKCAIRAFWDFGTHFSIFQQVIWGLE